jgi:hypothetical protein
VRLEFPRDAGEVHKLFLFCRYKAVRAQKHEAKEYCHDAKS